MRLSNLDAVPSSVRLPDYDPTARGIGWLHIGPGAFFRAHQAVYLDRALEFGGDWRIACVGLRSKASEDALSAQNCLYSVTSLEDKPITHVVGSIATAQTGPAAAHKWLTSPQIKVVSLTVTEKGYSADLGNLIAEALVARHEKNLGSIVFVSCDNLVGNGLVLRTLVENALSSENRFILDEHLFACSMVDRITPAVSESEKSRVCQILGLRDKACVLAEPFSQWVIDEKAQPFLPNLNKCGVQFVPDVSKFEDMKLRMLNGAHTALALSCVLLGKKTIGEGMKDPVLKNFASVVMDTAARSLSATGERTVSEYKLALIERFENPHVHHNALQISTDSSVKLSQRILSAASDLPRRYWNVAATTVALWLKYVQETPEFNDVNAEKIKACKSDRERLKLLKHPWQRRMIF